MLGCRYRARAQCVCVPPPSVIAILRFCERRRLRPNTDTMSHKQTTENAVRQGPHGIQWSPVRPTCWAPEKDGRISVRMIGDKVSPWLARPISLDMQRRSQPRHVVTRPNPGYNEIAFAHTAAAAWEDVQSLRQALIPYHAAPGEYISNTESPDESEVPSETAERSVPRLTRPPDSHALGDRTKARQRIASVPHHSIPKQRPNISVVEM